MGEGGGGGGGGGVWCGFIRYLLTSTNKTLWLWLLWLRSLPTTTITTTTVGGGGGNCISIHNKMMVPASLFQQSINSLQSNGRLGASQIRVWPSQMPLFQSINSVYHIFSSSIC